MLRVVTLLIVCSLVGAVLTYGPTVAGQPPTETGPKASKTGLSPIAYRRRVLPNGLTVYSIRNSATPTVAIQVWYHVGSKNDPEGRSGFAHLFEHLMFKSTRNMASETMDRLTEDVGGENNAFTSSDVTVYHETVPSHYLETLLWAEADRMGNLAVNDPNFQSERLVVEEEYRQSVLAPPYGRLDVLINEHSFTTHPYRRDTIGSIPDLDAASLQNVQDFHRTYYRPDNATLVVSGDFDDAQLDSWVDKYFGRVAKPEGTIPRVTTREPARTAERRYSESAPNVPLPALAVTYLVPPISHPDADALRLADVLLSSGESSRLYRALVYEQQVASETSADADLRMEAGLFTFHITAASGKSLDTVEKSLLTQIERLKSTPVSAAELRKARNLLLASTLSERETNEEVAFAVGGAAVLQGDPERANTDIARLQAVTAEDIQRVARTYFIPANRVVIRYQKGDVPTPAAAKAVTETKTPDTTPEPGQRETPPAPGKPRPAAFPTPVERKLPNGLRVIVVSRPGSGLVSAELVIGTGGAADPANKAGLASMTAGLLTRGAGGKSAPAIADEVEALGASLSGNTGWDGSFVTLLCPRANLAAVTPLFSAVVRRPDFAEVELDRLRDETLDNLQVELQSPGILASLTAARVLYGDGSYGHPLEGTLESVRRLTRADVTAFHTDHYHPGNATLVVGGDLTAAEGFALAEKAFGTWKAKPGTTRPAESIKALPTLPGGRVVVVDKPDAGQSAVVIIRPGITATDTDMYPALVTESVLGGGFSSRLNQEIRIRRGLSYGAFSRLSMRRTAGSLSASAQTKHETAPDVATIFRDELAGLVTSALPETELIPRKAAVTGEYARSLETGGGLVAEVAELAMYGRPLSELSRYMGSVEAVTAEQVKNFASRRLPAAEASIVIVGDGKVFLPALRQKFPNVEVIPVAQLDLNRARLMKE